MTENRGKDGAYSAIEREQGDGCVCSCGRKAQRGSTVAIAGEPGMHVYTVLGVDTMHGRVMVMDASGRCHRLPASALRVIA